MRWWQTLWWLIRVAPRTPSNGGGLSVWLYRWWNERFTGSGKMLLILWFTLIVIEMYPGKTGALYPAIGLSVALLVAWISTLRPPPLQAQWFFPSQIREGERAQIHLEITNQGTQSIERVGAWAFWEEKFLDLQGEPKVVASLQPGEKALLTLTFAAKRRGPCPMIGPTTYQVEPLGFMRSRRSMGTQASFAVQPSLIPVLQMPFLLQGRSGQAFAKVLHFTQQRRSDDLAGIRPYRPGDSLRDVHHKAWARWGKPMSREYEAERGQGILVYLDYGCQFIGERQLVEPTLQLTAGVVQYLHEHQALGRFVLGGEEVDLSRCASPLDSILDQLARIPRPTWWRWPKPRPCQWEAYPLGPVLLIGCSRFWLQQDLPQGKRSKKLMVQNQSFPPSLNDSDQTLILHSEWIQQQRTTGVVL